MTEETKFPESDGHYEYIATYEAESVDDWFRRAIEDFPKCQCSIYEASMYNQYDPSPEDWFRKWLSQFMEVDKND